MDSEGSDGWNISAFCATTSASKSTLTWVKSTLKIAETFWKHCGLCTQSVTSGVGQFSTQIACDTEKSGEKTCKLQRQASAVWKEHDPPTLVELSDGMVLLNRNEPGKCWFLNQLLSFWAHMKGLILLFNLVDGCLLSLRSNWVTHQNVKSLWPSWAQLRKPKKIHQV